MRTHGVDHAAGLVRFADDAGRALTQGLHGELRDVLSGEDQHARVAARSAQARQLGFSVQKAPQRLVDLAKLYGVEELLALEE